MGEVTEVAGPRLRELLDAAARGVFPPADGIVEVCATPIGCASAVVAFSAHFVVCAPVSVDWVAAHLDLDDFAASHSPGFLQALGQRLGRQPGALDSALVGHADDAALAALDALAADGLAQVTDSTHPRVRRALHHRDDVRVFALPDGAAHLIIGRGVAGRLEAAFEVAPTARGNGLGRRLAVAARGMAVDEPIWMQVSPGNVASLRAVLAADYTPACAEVLFPPLAT